MSISVFVKFKGIYLPGYKPETTPTLKVKRRTMTVVPAGTEWSRFKFQMNNQSEDDLVVANDIVNRGLFILQNLDDEHDIVWDYAQRSFAISATGAGTTLGVENLLLTAGGSGYVDQLLDDGTVTGVDAWATSAGGAGAEAWYELDERGVITKLHPQVAGAGYTAGLAFALDFSGDPYGSGATGTFDVVNIAQTTITANGHGLSDGDYVFLYGVHANLNGGSYISDVTTNTFNIPRTDPGASQTGNFLAPRLYTYRLKPGEFTFFRSGQSTQELYGMIDYYEKDASDLNGKLVNVKADLICVEE